MLQELHKQTSWCVAPPVQVRLQAHSINVRRPSKLRYHAAASEPHGDPVASARGMNAAVLAWDDIIAVGISAIP